MDKEKAQSTSRPAKRPADTDPEGQSNSKKMGDRNRRNSTSKKDSSTSELEATMLAIEKRQTERMDRLLAGMENNGEQVKSLRKLITDREEAILGEVKEMDAKTNARIDALVNSMGPQNRSRDSKHHDAYQDHRRALRIWPVPGPEIKPNLTAFLKEKLKITDDELKRLGNISFKKFRDPTSNDNEVLITFETKRARDAVKAAGKHLAGLAGKAGMKIHVPGHLQSNFNLLQSLGYHLKQTDDSIRRSIKFDDDAENLVMDIFVDGAWSRIRPEEAKAVAEKNPSVASGPKVLSADKISGILNKKTPATGANATPM